MLQSWVSVGLSTNKLLVIFLSDACVLSEEIMKSHNITYRWKENQKIYLQSGDYVEFKCKYRYRKANTSPPLRTMCINGHIDYPSCSKINSWLSRWMKLCWKTCMHITYILPYNLHYTYNLSFMYCLTHFFL